MLLISSKYFSSWIKCGLHKEVIVLHLMFDMKCHKYGTIQAVTCKQEASGHRKGNIFGH